MNIKAYSIHDLTTSTFGYSKAKFLIVDCLVSGTRSLYSLKYFSKSSQNSVSHILHKTTHSHGWSNRAQKIRTTNFVPWQM